MRCYLGLWQTIRLHGFWPGRFWAELGPFLVEVVLICLFSLVLPILIPAHLAVGADTPAFALNLSVTSVSPVYLLAAFVVVDYTITILVSLLERRPSLLVYGLVFPALRLLEAALLLAAGKLFFVTSHGRWTSPTRRAGERAAAPAFVRAPKQGAHRWP